MITVSPAQVVPYAPPTMPVAAVKVGSVTVIPDLNFVAVQFQLQTAAGVSIPIDRTQIPRMTTMDQQAYLAALSAGGGVEAAALPWLKKAYGITGAVGTAALSAKK